MENLGGIVAGGLIGAVVPVLFGLLGFARLSGKIEERVNNLKEAVDRFQGQFDAMNRTLVNLTERIAKQEAEHGLS
ncbi:MAG TPA: YtxH domain-containing protein [Actinomycetota bacterium]|jgi:gas vesicle protein